MTTETSERENIVCGAKLAEQGGHYDARRLNLSIEQKKVAEMNNNDCGQVKNNAIRDICSDILNVLEKHLIPCTSIGESLVFYYKMKGDYYRYLAEFVTSSDRKDAAENALVAYKKTSDIAMTDLPPTHPLRLDLVLNFSMLYDDILNSPDRAYQLAFGAIGELKTFSDDSDRGSDAILQLLREKIKLWKAADRLKQLSEIQRYLDDQVINEDYPGIVIEFRDSRLVEFIYIATSKQTSETVHFKNLALSPIGIIRAIRDKVIPAGVRCVSTSSLIVFVPNTFQQCTNILVALSYYISDPWFQSVLRQMPSGPFLGYISSLTTNKITDMEPLKLEIPLQLQPFQESEVEKV